MMRYDPLASILQLCDKLEEEMKIQGMWREEGVARATSGPWGGADQTFVGWLQGTLLPAVREAARLNDFPGRDDMVRMAFRELDNDPQMARILRLLSLLDAAVDRARRM